MFERSSASAPASIANLNSGFDILGIAFPALQDTVHLEQCHSSKGIWIRSIKGADLPYLPHQNTATIPLLQMHKDFNWTFGLAVDIDKQIPIASGLGGSAASAVAAVKAASVWTPTPIHTDQKLHYASLGEAISSGTTAHFDNIAPALLEELILVTTHNQSTIRVLPCPKGLTFIIWHPNIQIHTSASRQQLKKDIPLKLHIKQSGFLASSICDLYAGNMRSWARQLQDLIIEPQRKEAIPNYDQAKNIAIQEGALCFGISGSGPSCFAICDKQSAASITKKVSNAFTAKVNTWEYTF